MSGGSKFLIRAVVFIVMSGGVFGFLSAFSEKGGGSTRSHVASAPASEGASNHKGQRSHVVAADDDFAERGVTISNDPGAGPFRWGIWQSEHNGAKGPGQCDKKKLMKMHSSTEIATCLDGTICSSPIRLSVKYVRNLNQTYTQLAGISPTYERLADGKTVRITKVDFRPDLNTGNDDVARRSVDEMNLQLPLYFYKCN